MLWFERNVSLQLQVEKHFVTDLSTTTATTARVNAEFDAANDEDFTHAVGLTFAPSAGESARALESARTEVTFERQFCPEILARQPNQAERAKQCGANLYCTRNMFIKYTTDYIILLLVIVAIDGVFEPLRFREERGVLWVVLHTIRWQTRQSVVGKSLVVEKFFPGRGETVELHGCGPFVVQIFRAPEQHQRRVTNGLEDSLDDQIQRVSRERYELDESVGAIESRLNIELLVLGHGRTNLPKRRFLLRSDVRFVPRREAFQKVRRDVPL